MDSMENPAGKVRRWCHMLVHSGNMLAYSSRNIRSSWAHTELSLEVHCGVVEVNWALLGTHWQLLECSGDSMEVTTRARSSQGCHWRGAGARSECSESCWGHTGKLSGCHWEQKHMPGHSWPLKLQTPQCQLGPFGDHQGLPVGDSWVPLSATL